ncbi:uncharacterized protein LOC142983399 [Anticarsia gemmatalis]|uniref:uncharacterized protein LOC142983399 n=1 Tax=Anticarsia gemmatalis TaxID=129554 RepID=UPI003F7719C4
MINKNYVEEVIQLFESYIERLQKVYLHFEFLYNRSELKKRQDKIIENAKDISYAIIRKRKSEYQTANSVEKTVRDKHVPILDLLLDYSIHDGLFTENEIREHLETFISASFDTTGTALVYALKLLGCHPAVQDRLFKEIEEVFEGTDRDVEKDDLSKLTYLEAVAKETIRLYPVVPVIARTAETDVKLKNYTIPHGTDIVGCIYVLNRLPAWGEDANEFRPERWLEGKCPPEAVGKFAGFSVGKRNCIGELYAMITMKITLAHIIRRYRIIADNDEIKLKFNILLKPVSGHEISLEKRKQTIDLLLDYSVNDGLFTENEIREHLETFIIASFDTTGTTLVFALKLLICHPAAQDRLFKELKEVFEGTDRDVEKDDLSKLVYLEAVAKETIRLYPVIPVIARTAETDVKLKNYTIPSGSDIVGSIFVLNRLPAWGEDANEFRPERWLEGKCPPEAVGKFAGFSVGKRNCVGEQYALTTMKVPLAHIVRRYRIIADDDEIRLKFNVFLKPVSGRNYEYIVVHVRGIIRRGKCVLPTFCTKPRASTTSVEIMMLQIFLYVIFFGLLLWWVTKRKSFKETPLYPGALPFLGHALLMLGDGVHLLELWKKISYYTLKVGGVSKLHIVTRNFYFITDPDDFQTVMNTCLDKSYIHDFSKEWVGNGLLTADVVTWKKNRKLFGPAFTQRAIHRFLDVFNNQSRRLVDRLATEVGKGTFNHRPYIVNNMLETVNRTTLGLTSDDSNMINANYANEAGSLIDMYVERFQKIWLYPPFVYYFSDLKRRHDKVLNKLKAISFALINAKKTEFLQNNNGATTISEGDCIPNYIFYIDMSICFLLLPGPCFHFHSSLYFCFYLFFFFIFIQYNKEFFHFKLIIFLNSWQNKPKTILDIIFESHIKDNGFTDEETREHLETFVFGGFHTTGTQLVFLLKAVASHPDVQDEILKELDRVFEGSDRDVEKEDLSKLNYLEAVIKETIRVYPIVPIIVRDTNIDLKLKNYTIPRGATCVGSIYGLNRHPAWGKDVEEFSPERFLDPNRPEDCYFAGFSIGRRNCIGVQYTYIVMKTLLAHIFRRYRVATDDSKLVLRWNAYVTPLSGHHISLELRK